jgi:hypothetical protein
MKRAVAILVVLGLTMMSAFAAQAAGTTGGEDANPGDDVPFTVEERTTPSQDGKTWALSLVMDQDALDNGTTFAITSQICLNNGVCDPPVNQDITVSDDGSTYTTDLTPPEDHSYVNWRVKATYSDDSTENFPQNDWYKTWSTCYYDDGSYGGVHADGDGCNVPSSGESEGFLPSIGVVLTLTVLTGAALVGTVRRL